MKPLHNVLNALNFACRVHAALRDFDVARAPETNALYTRHEM